MPAVARVGLGATIALLAALALAPAASLGASTPATPYQAVAVPPPDVELRARWGESMATAGDLDGDGKPDLWVSTTFLDTGGVTNAGRVYALSGATRKVVYVIDPPESQQGAAFGAFLAALGDVTDDGVPDVVVGTDAQDVGPDCGTPEPNACNEDQGKAWVFNGRTGALLYGMDNPEPQGDGVNRARFGSRLGTAGDVTGDGRPDPFVGASHNDVPAGCGSDVPIPAGCRVDQGQAFIFDGVTGTLVRTYDFPADDHFPAGGGTCTGSCGWFGHSVQTPGDVNGDGVDDQLVGAGSAAHYTGSGGPCGSPEPNGCNEFQGRLYLYSGATGSLLRKFDAPAPDRGVLMGFQDVEPYSPGDITGDGRADVFGSGSQEGEFGGEGFLFNGHTGAFLFPLNVPDTEVGKQGWSMTRTDYNGDGTPDIYLGVASSFSLPTDQNGGTYVYDGRDGSLLKALELPEADRQVGIPGNTGPFLGWATANLGDVNGDGGPDYAAAAAPYDDGVIDAGRVYFFLSQIPPPAPAPAPPAPPAPPPPPAASGLATAKLALARATINRRVRVLDVLAPITRLASGRVNVELHAAGRRFRFTAPVNSRDGRIRFRQRIPKAQADLGTGILTIRYRGDADTRPQTVRLRAASQKAELRLQRPTIADGRLRASGTVSKRARGVVRVQIQYVTAGETHTREFKARINNGRWSLNERLTQTVRTAIAQRTGTVHSYTLFTGYYPRRIRGEMRSFQILGDR